MLALLLLPEADLAGDLTDCHDARAAQKAQDYDLAVEAYTRCLNAPHLSPEQSARIYNNRGGINYLRGLVDRAIADVTQALRLDPSLASAHHIRGVAYYNKGLTERAIDEFDEAIRLNPSHAGAFSNRGGAYVEMGLIDQAIEDLDEAIRLNPSHAGAYRNRGGAYRDKGLIDRAIEDHTEAIRLDPANSDGYYNRAAAYFEKGLIEKEIEDFNEVIRLDSSRTRAHLYRGALYFSRGRFPDAISDLLRAVADKPSDAYAVIWLYLAEARAGQKNLLELRKNAKDLDPTAWPFAVVQMFLGELSWQAVADMGHSDATREDKERRAEAYFYVGEELLMTGDRKYARELFEGVIETGITSFFEYVAAKGELERL